MVPMEDKSDSGLFDDYARRGDSAAVDLVGPIGKGANSAECEGHPRTYVLILAAISSSFPSPRERDNPPSE